MPPNVSDSARLPAAARVEESSSTHSETGLEVTLDAGTPQSQCYIFSSQTLSMHHAGRLRATVNRAFTLGLEEDFAPWISGGRHAPPLFQSRARLVDLLAPRLSPFSPSATSIPRMSRYPSMHARTPSSASASVYTRNGAGGNTRSWVYPYNQNVAPAPPTRPAGPPPATPSFPPAPLLETQP
ncbi:unnamed protein product [Cyclocybe aegerita]|uniref:Uncharacterized protein n=1 Tax=Cyclocybe aegerita TaxID=1973307 RepID=A0A8S0WTB9_CYCAE|nr:unnamed protein product [Cyclocybe aegerita]